MSATTVATPVRSYSIDKAHSEIAFRVRHLLTRVRGRFAEFEGTVHFDAADPTRSRVEVTIQARSIDTSEPTRDSHLRTSDFFSADEYPTLTFVSRRIVRRGDAAFDVIGDLTLRGVTREVTLPVSFLGEAKDPWGGDRLFFEADLTINRRDFGMHWNAALETGGLLVGDEVTISLAVEAVGQ
jgi:polyisoprenoid-binding protein YceI